MANRLKQPENAQAREATQRRHILNRVMAFYQQTFQEDRTALGYLKEKGLREVSLFSEFKVGYANGSLLATIPEDGELMRDLKTLGVLAQDGREVLQGCVVFPWFDENGDCSGAWGLRMENGEGLYLQPLRGVWNYQAARRSRSIILTDSILSALFLYQAGFREVIPCFGKQLNDDQLSLLQRGGIKEVYSSVYGNVLDQLRDEEIACYPVVFPPLPAEPEEIQRVIETANPKTPVISEVVKKEKVEEFTLTETGFFVQYENRWYEVKGVERKGIKLLATIQIGKKGGGPLHLDSLDLYSSRSRIVFGKSCAIVLGEKEETVFKDLVRLIDLTEKHQPKQNERKAPVLTKEEEAEALAFLKDPKLLERILEDFEKGGYTGEEGNKLMGYLAAVSRKLQDPLSVLIQSRSAAGKSTLQDAVLRFVPPEDLLKYTRLTSQALFYAAETGLAHKLLAIEEEAGAREASYSIRNLQSSKALSIATTGKDPATGKLKTTEYQVKGPVALMLTTTAVDMDYETQNRFITLTIDESREMTERILIRQRELETLEGLRKSQGQEGVVKLHHNAQRLLKSLWVVNPFAPKLTFPAHTLRARRDHRKYLGIIKTIAFLHQYQREVKTFIRDGGEVVPYIEVTPSDIEKANRLSGEVLERTLDELSAPSRALLGVIQAMVKEKGKAKPDYRFTRRDIREFSGWSDFQVKTHIGELADLEYLWSVAGKKGKEYIYELVAAEGEVDGKPFLAGLKTVDNLTAGKV